MNPALLLGVGLAGGAGAVLRFVVDDALSTRRPSRFPVATLLVNVSGSLLLGLVTGVALLGAASPPWAVVVGSGFCGGFTTFSTTSLASIRLAQDGLTGLSVLNALGTLLLSVAAAGAGLAVALALR